MKKLITLVGLATLVGGCSWIGHGDNSSSANSGEGTTGVDYGTGRGTTGISSGAGAGQGITGSDAAPPR